MRLHMYITIFYADTLRRLFRNRRPKLAVFWLRILRNSSVPNELLSATRNKPGSLDQHYKWMHWQQRFENNSCTSWYFLYRCDIYFMLPGDKVICCRQYFQISVVSAWLKLTNWILYLKTSMQLRAANIF